MAPPLTTARLVCLAAALSGAVGCASAPGRFAEGPVVLELDDRRPIPVPRPGATAVRPDRSFTQGLATRRAADVNALDETVSSTFYTPRIETGLLSADEIARGPGDGPPEVPLLIEEVMSADPPVLTARDRRGRRFSLRLDAAGREETESAAASIASRLLWAFGLDAAPQYVLSCDRADLGVTDRGHLTELVLASMLRRAATTPDGRVRAGAMRLPEGQVLGALSAQGVRGDDPNDRIPHEDRRALRALRVVSAWIGLPEIAARHTIDTYDGDPGSGYVRHLFASPYDALGMARLGPKALDEERYLTLGDVGLNLLRFGVVASGGAAFDVASLDFSRWGPAFGPARYSQPDDDYWAAKVLMRFGEEHVRAAVQAGQISTPASVESLTQTLLQRRRRIVDEVFARVTPVEVVGVTGGELLLRDLAPAARPPERRFEVRIEDDRGHRLEPRRIVTATGDSVRIASEHLPGGRSPVSYVRVVVRCVDRGAAERSAELHVRTTASGAPYLAGVLH